MKAPTASSTRVCATITGCKATEFIAIPSVAGVSNTVCSNITACSAGNIEVAPATITTDRKCGCPYLSGMEYLDILTCSILIDARYISSSLATALVNPDLTYAENYLYIFRSHLLQKIEFPSLSHIGAHLYVSENEALTRLNLASLSYLGGHLVVQMNSALTYATFSKLSNVAETIKFCQNNVAFILPNPIHGTASEPGLTSVMLQGGFSCDFKQGDQACTETEQCP